MTATATTATPRWSARPFTARDREPVLAFFTEPDFHFRTAQPDTRSEAEIDALLDDSTRVLLADGEPVGLYGVEDVGSEHGSHIQLDLRLRGSAPDTWWPAALEEVLRGLRWSREIVRVTVRVGAYDTRGLAAARAAGLTEEGTLGDIELHDGVRSGTVFFSRIWAPTS
ncbi:hypothetical protein MTQ10_22670 [Streptomyces sp. XM83C]|jgi:hypothetical protein|uniref:N-acetyltransferase domain-containing protein n=1 Tax=Streptomyces thermocoprophilus TaxID=78356 RepID=A0ABV5VJ25_9ACTN|nr:hypothetical protein [Streptomyces sp. XM83C]MCK1822335.1 hypothetical protein [Streptomyces sp. XM83C]